MTAGCLASRYICTWNYQGLGRTATIVGCGGPGGCIFVLWLWLSIMFLILDPANMLPQSTAADGARHNEIHGVHKYNILARASQICGSSSMGRGFFLGQRQAHQIAALNAQKNLSDKMWSDSDVRRRARRTVWRLSTGQIRTT